MTNAQHSKTAFPITMSDRQGPLAELYAREPSESWITDLASTSTQGRAGLDPLHGKVCAGGVSIPVALHSAVGGNSDGPVPGDLLCAAMASCMDSTLRVVANRLGITLHNVAVTVSADVDVRGTLCLEPTVPVEFQKMHVSVNLEAEPDTRPALLTALINTTERCCVVMQTLQKPLQVSTQFSTGQQ